MGTASTMNSLTEALGIALPGNGATPAVDADRMRIAEQSGRRIVQLAIEGVRLSTAAIERQHQLPMERLVVGLLCGQASQLGDEGTMVPEAQLDAAAHRSVAEERLELGLVVGHRRVQAERPVGVLGELGADDALAVRTHELGAPQRGGDGAESVEQSGVLEHPLDLVVHHDRAWQVVDAGRPFEVFCTLGKAGGSAFAHAEAMGRLMSLALRYGVPITSLRDQLRGISSDRAVGVGPNKVLSAPDAIGQAIEVPSIAAQ